MTERTRRQSRAAAADRDGGKRAAAAEDRDRDRREGRVLGAMDSLMPFIGIDPMAFVSQRTDDRICRLKDDNRWNALHVSRLLEEQARDRQRQLVTALVFVLVVIFVLLLLCALRFHVLRRSAAEQPPPAAPPPPGPAATQVAAPAAPAQAPKPPSL